MPGPRYTHSELEALWIDAGGLATEADVAAAIAQAESGGCQYSLAGPVDVRPIKSCPFRQTAGENSMGLWQINRNAHPAYDADYLFTPQGNAAAAVQIASKGTTFLAWSTYTNGVYKGFLTGKVTPVAVPATFGVSPSGAVLAGGPNPFGGSTATTTPPSSVAPPAGPVGPTDGTGTSVIPASVIDAMEHFRGGLGRTVPYYLHRSGAARKAIREAVRGR